MSPLDLLKVQIDKREDWAWNATMLEKYAIGLLGVFPAEDGNYVDIHGTPITIEMHAEQSMSGLWVIAVTSNVFGGHERTTGGRGSTRRTVHMDAEKSKSGSTDLTALSRLALSIVRD